EDLALKSRKRTSQRRFPGFIRAAAGQGHFSFERVDVDDAVVKGDDIRRRVDKRSRVARCQIRLESATQAMQRLVVGVPRRADWQVGPEEIEDAVARETMPGRGEQEKKQSTATARRPIALREHAAADGDLYPSQETGRQHGLRSSSRVVDHQARPNAV